jgi:hypothetical protein
MFQPCPEQVCPRHMSCLQSYGRALELEPGRLYCLVQQGALQYQMGAFTEAVATYTRWVWWEGRGGGCLIHRRQVRKLSSRSLRLSPASGSRQGVL